MATVLYRNNEANHESSVSAVGKELLSIKRELCTLRQVMSTVCASTIHQAVSPDAAAPQAPVFANQTPLNQLVVTNLQIGILFMILPSVQIEQNCVEEMESRGPPFLWSTPY